MKSQHMKNMDEETLTLLTEDELDTVVAGGSQVDGAINFVIAVRAILSFFFGDS